MTCDTVSTISNWFSLLSLGSWMCAQVPQIYTNYRNNSAEGISPGFLILWFMGDFLSFTSCILNDTLKFQIYLSAFFIANDVTLCYQYYYYNSVYPRISYKGIVVDNHDQGEEENITTATSVYTSDEQDYVSANKIAKTAVVASLVTNVSAMKTTETSEHHLTIGVVLAWTCAIVYIASRCPQLYKNHQRKSVQGINPILFASALLGNVSYTLSILTSCEFLYNSARSQFLFKELPYIIGSSGTIIFDAWYFYQKYLYRHSGSNTHVIGLDNWDG